MFPQSLILHQEEERQANTRWLYLTAYRVIASGLPRKDRVTPANTESYGDMFECRVCLCVCGERGREEERGRIEEGGSAGEGKREGGRGGRIEEGVRGGKAGKDRGGRIEEGRRGGKAGKDREGAREREREREGRVGERGKKGEMCVICVSE